MNRVVMHTMFISMSISNFQFHLTSHEEEIWMIAFHSQKKKDFVKIIKYIIWSAITLIIAIIILDWILNLQKSMISFISA